MYINYTNKVLVNKTLKTQFYLTKDIIPINNLRMFFGIISAYKWLLLQ